MSRQIKTYMVTDEQLKRLGRFPWRGMVIGLVVGAALYWGVLRPLIVKPLLFDQPSEEPSP